MRRVGLLIIALLLFGIVPGWGFHSVEAAVPLVSIQDIQGYSASSPYVGQVVKTQGVVTAVTKRGFFIQNGSGAWRGIYVYVTAWGYLDSNHVYPAYSDGTPVRVGDVVEVMGNVTEYNGFTQIKIYYNSASHSTVGSITKLGVSEVPDPVVLSTGEVSQEQWESVLVKVENAIVTNPDLGYGEWEVDDGSGPVRIDDLIYKYTPQNGEAFKYIVGPVFYSYGNFKIEPRNAEDIIPALPEILNVTVAPMYSGESTINVTIRNNYRAEFPVLLNVNASDGFNSSQDINLAPNETRSVLIPWNPTLPGEYTIDVELRDSEGKVIDSKVVSVKIVCGVDLESYNIPGVILVGEKTALNFTLRNNYSTSKRVSFSVVANGISIYQNDSLELPAGSPLHLSIPWSAPRYGTYTINATLKLDGILVSTVEAKVFAQYNVTPTETVSLYPLEDAYSYYYEGTEFSWKNYHAYYDKRELAIGNSSKFTQQRVYFKFNVPAVPEGAELVSAVLKVYVPYIKYFNVPMEVGVYNTTSEWNESSTPNRPPLPGILLDSTRLSKGWVSWNVTQFIANHTNSTVSLLLKLANESVENYAWIYSKENPSNKPYLEITYKKPVRIENFENFTVAILGNATVNEKKGGLAVSVGMENYSFKVSTQNIFIDAKNFDPQKPSLLAYWKAELTGYEILKNEYTAESTLTRTVKVTRNTVVMHLAMGTPSMAVLVVPKMGEKVVSVQVIKDSGRMELKENAFSSDLGYYYILPEFVVVVLKKDPTDVVVTFESYAITTIPAPLKVFYKLSLHYTIFLKLHDGDLENAYLTFENLTGSLRQYNVDLSSVPVGEITRNMEAYRSRLSKLPMDMVNFTKYRFSLYSIFINARQAFMIYNDLMGELETWNPVLNATLAKVLEAQQMANQTASGGNETATNQTSGNGTVIVPPVSNESREMRVLIDYSHDQYYARQIEELKKLIFTELGWKLSINTEPLTYDLLKNYQVVILINPKTPLTSSEVQALQEYVENGGGLFITGDWYKYANVKSLNAVTEKYGITFNADEVIDRKRNSGKPYYPFVGVYNREHAAMRFIPDDWTIYYNGESLTLSGNAVWLIKAFDTAYTVDSKGNVVVKQGEEPVVAAAVQVGNGRIVAYGSSRALSDAFYHKYIKSNWPFIKGVLLWLAHQE